MHCYRIPPRKEYRGLCTPTILYDSVPTGKDGLALSIFLNEGKSFASID
jgi:hypothetical protein